jgi:RimJ/RimL family protein N-acetyltransferase
MLHKTSTWIFFMTMYASLLANPNPYTGPIDLSFDESQDDHLEVHIETEALKGEFVNEGDIEDYLKLFADPLVMEKYAEGKPREKEAVEKRVRSSWMKRWQEDKMPYTAIAFRKNDTDEFVSHVVAGSGDLPGQSEMAYITNRIFWGRGFTKQATTAVVNEFLPLMIQKEYKVECKPLNELLVTVRTDNPASIRVAVSLGMEMFKIEERFDSQRLHFRKGF